MVFCSRGCPAGRYGTDSTELRGRGPGLLVPFARVLIVVSNWESSLGN